MFSQLRTALILETGFQRVRNDLKFKPGNIRKLFIANEVKELRKNSGFTTEAEYRLIDVAFVVEAVRIKVDAYFRSLQVLDGGYKVHYTSGGTPYHCKTNYMREGDARRAVIKLNARQGGGYSCSKVADYVAATRGRIVINMMSRLPVMETTGTNFTSSVASESYWSA